MIYKWIEEHLLAKLQRKKQDVIKLRWEKERLKKEIEKIKKHHPQ